MHTPRFFYQGDLAVNALITLPADASHHLLNVLRIKPGEAVIIFNGNGKEFLGRYVNHQKKSAQITIESMRDCPTESSLFIELGQAISRGEKMDYAIQKAVELGVNRIVPLFTQRCAVKFKEDRQEKRMAHWRNVVIHACEQSGRCRLPELSEPLTLAQWFSLKKEGVSLVCDPYTKQSLRNIKQSHRVNLLIGPESGLTEEEITQAKMYGFSGFSLGPRILRTETATVAALAILQYTWGNAS